MLLSLSWLREFTPFEGSVEELAHRLTMVGLEVEEITRPFENLSSLIVGRVVQKKPHPSSDKLSLCTVDVGGSEYLSIVCGAPNVDKDQNVAVALDGTRLPSGQEVQKTRIRGEESQGMICSQVELNLGQDASGIMVLQEGIAPGTRLDQALDLEEHVLDVGVTPNRPDCLSVLGLAREVATVFDLPLHPPRVGLSEDSSRDCTQEISIEIDDPEKCPLYQARLISGCTVQPSPDWLQRRLLAVGVRPINNIVDVTNYVMLELGQPLHAFDRNRLEGSVIRVARAEQGLYFTTLDNQERQLSEQDLLIQDGNKPIALAGVMGGANTEISQDSSEVLLECAVFDPLSIRHTARRLGLSSESSFRFERGVDQVNSQFALDRAAELLARVSGGKVAQGVARSQPRPYQFANITLRLDRVTSLLALDVDLDYCRKVLEALGCTVQPKQESLEVTPPGYRPDLTREVDLIEEIGRIYGLDRTPEHLPRVQKSLHQENMDPEYAFEGKIKQWAQGLGLQEVINYNFVGMADLDFLNLPREGRVQIYNPLSEEQDVMRLDLLPGLLHTLRLNLGQGNPRMRLFEVARSFEQDQSYETGVRENNRLALLLYGPRYRGHWPHPEEDTDFYDLKGLVEHLLKIFAGEEGGFRLGSDHPYLDPCVVCQCRGQDLGRLGRVRSKLARGYKARKDIWFADLDLDKLQEIYASLEPRFQALPKFPVVKRDMTIVAPLDLEYASIREVVEQARLNAAPGSLEEQDLAGQSRANTLEEVTLVDVYYPEESREKKLTMRFTYRHKERTLQDEEVNWMHQHIADTLQEKLPVGFP